MNMKKHYVYILIMILLLSASCSEFEKMNTNPDNTTQVTPGLIATGQLVDMMWKGSAKNYFYDTFVSKQFAMGEQQESYQYNRFGRTGFGTYQKLTNCLKMVEAADGAAKEGYAALAKFMIAYQLYDITLSVGDIPYSDAFQGEGGVVKPKYDTQKDVMIQILDDLEEAYTGFSNAAIPLDGDIIFDGDYSKWKKTVTAMQLKVLISLSKKESDTDLNIRQRFSDIVAARPLMASNSDNFQLVYGNESSKICPLHRTKNSHTPYAMITSVVVDTLKKYNDYRLFYFGKPSPVKIKEGYTASDWEAYPGTDPAASFSDVKELYSLTDYTFINNRYTEIETGEPLVRLGYAQQNFILAEACLRRWITGDANDYYLKGIRASMEFILENTPDSEDYHHGRQMTDGYIEAYLANPDIQLAGTPGTFERDLNKIITQKYLSAFIQYPWESYYEYRRTGYPVLPINPNTNLNRPADKMPMRWMYEQRELDFNRDNVEEAIQRQYNGNDDVNELMWILK